MKYFLMLCLSLSVMLLPGADELGAVLEPNTVLPGEGFSLVLSSDSGQMPELQQLPQDFVFQGKSQSTKVINGQYSMEAGYRFQAPGKPGTYTLPSLTVKLGKSTKQTPELQLKVMPDNAPEAQGANTDLVFEANLGLPQRKEFYVGEDVPLFFYLFYPRNFKIRTAYPQVEAGKSVFQDFRNENPENPNFAPVRHGTVVQDGQALERLTFYTIFRPLASGKLQVSGTIQCELLIPERRRQQRDPFFEGFFGNENYRRVPKNLQAKLPEIEIKSLPPVPAGAIYSGLVGQYTGNWQISSDQTALQEAVSLTLELAGSSSWETLQIPVLNFPGFRVYPGEVGKKGGRCTIRYAMIPLQPGDFQLQKDFLTFNPETGSYQAIRLDAALKVTGTPSNPASSATVPSQVLPQTLPDTPEISQNQTKTEQKTPTSTLLYCKTAPGKRANSHWLFYVILLGIAGPLGFFAHEWYGNARAKRQSDPEHQRRERAGNRRKQLLAKISNEPAEKLSELVTGEVTAYLADRWGLAPGATPEETAKSATDPELAEVLKQCGEASYLPPDLAKSALPAPEKIRKVLLKTLKIFVLAMLLWSVSSLDAAEAVNPWQVGLNAYDQGNVTEAKKIFEEELVRHGADANLLYNLGCLEAAENHGERALWYMERAHWLDPQDSAIRENCNVLRRKFFLPEIGLADSPLAMLNSWRDRFHPEDFWVLTAAMWFFLWIVWSFRKALPMRWLTGLTIVLVFFSIVFLASGIMQKQSVYRANQGLVIVPTAELYSFPGVLNARKTGVLTGGTPVDVLEARPDFVHVQGPDQDGWVKSTQIGRLP